MNPVAPLLLPGAIPIANNSLYPISFDICSPTAGTAAYLENSFLRLLVGFFQDKGVEALKREDCQEGWYQDWLDYQTRHGLYASLLSPQQYSSRGHRFDIFKLARFVETFGYFSPGHAYSLHVSLLGLFPILMSTNEPLKKEAIAKLEQGGLFAFAVSEKAHGSDLFANEFTVKPSGGGWVADGTKYYIGNANAACLIAVMAKKAHAAEARTTKRAPFVLFALRPAQAPAFGNVRKIRTLGVRTAFVGSFAVADHHFLDSDFISLGHEAWDAVRATVNFGKFFLGFGSIGICEHALAEAIAHMRTRVLFGKPVVAMPHIRTALVLAFARLTAMKLYAYRALDYLQASCEADRRYLLWSAVQKAKVSTEGVKVMANLSECIGARGFEADTYFEEALRDAQLVPSLEGSTHINFGLTAQFLAPYFAAAEDKMPSPPSLVLQPGDPDENSYWLAAHNRIARTVRFAHFLTAYEPLHQVANVRLFEMQVTAFHRFAAEVPTAHDEAPHEGGPASHAAALGDTGQLIAIGKCLATIAYGQLIAENCQAAAVAMSTVSVMFHALVEDLGAEALKLSALFLPDSLQRVHLQDIVQVPQTDAADFQAVAEFIGARYGWLINE